MIAARLVVLDIGATLVSGPARTPTSRIAASLHLGGPQKAELRRALMTTHFRGRAELFALVRNLSDAADAAVDAIVSDVWVAQELEAQPLPGAAEALADLTRRGFKLAIISNIWQPYLTSVRRHFGSFFDEHVPSELQLFSFREGCIKPSHTLFRRALSTAGVEPQEAVMVGDSYVEDIEPATELGMSTVLVLHRPQREAPHLARVLNGEAPAPSRTIRTIGELSANVSPLMRRGSSICPTTYPTG